MKKCQFTKEEYYSNKENKKIDLLCELNEKGKFERYEFHENYYFMNIENTIQEIWKDLDGEISSKKLEEFLDNEEQQTIKRLGLIRIILRDFDPETHYKDLQKINEQIKDDIKELSFIKNSLLLFHRNIYQREIKDISIIITNIQELKINNYRSERTQMEIYSLKKLKSIVENIEKFKDFLLFKVLYDEAFGSDQERRFNEASKQLDNIKALFNENITAQGIYQKNKEIFDKIKDMLSNNESKAELFIEKMINYFNIERQELINELTIIFKSKIYEMDLKSIIIKVF